MPLINVTDITNNGLPENNILSSFIPNFIYVYKSFTDKICRQKIFCEISRSLHFNIDIRSVTNSISLLLIPSIYSSTTQTYHINIAITV